MNKKAERCDNLMLSLYLLDELPAKSRNEFLAHLESCESCQAALDKDAAEVGFWSEAANLLAKTSDGPIPCADATGTSRRQLAIKTVLDWLLPTDDPEMLGRVGEYEISGVVGFGGMGAVLKGFDKSLLRIVAIKVMAPHLADNGSARARFEREARAAAAISHDNVVDIYQVSEMNGLPYLVMPFARGPSLQKRIDEGGPLTTIQVVQVGRQIASGLTAAHDQGLVHRDIKPANILLNDSVERLLITDFGVASVIDDVSMTQTGMIAGTPQFMSPEQARGEAVDPTSDLFSLGAVLYTACTGRPPFRADVPMAVLRKITDTEARPVREINPEVPEWLERMISRLMEKEKTERFTSAVEVERLFEQCLTHLRQPTQAELPQAVRTLPPAGCDHSGPAATPVASSSKIPKKVQIAVAVLATVAASLFQLMSAPDIKGSWHGELWTNIQLKSVEEADDWISGTFVNNEGKKGAIHLEWSSLRRRFDGRWSVGAEESGTIVLRQSGRSRNASVRGAILVDGDVGRDRDDIRLRDFEWTPRKNSQSAQASSDPAALQTRRLATERAENDRRKQLIYSPVKGVVTKLSPILTNLGSGGVRVSQGDFLLEINPTAADWNKQLQEQHANLQEKLRTWQAKADAYSRNADDYVEARDFSVAAAEELVKAAKAKYESRVHAMEVLKAEAEREQLELDRVKKLVDSGLRPQREFDNAKANWKVASAKLKSEKSELEMLKNEQQAKMLERDEKKRVAQTKIDYCTAMRDDALSQIASIRKQLADVESRISESEVLQISAPRSGFVVGPILERGMVIKEGDLLFEISPIRNNPPPEQVSIVQSTTLQSVPALLKLATDLEKRIVSASEEIQKHEEQEKWLHDQAEQLRRNLTQLDSHSGKTAHKMYAFEAMDATGQEIRDVIEAPNEDKAQEIIREMGYFLTKIAAKESRRKLEKSRLDAAEVQYRNLLDSKAKALSRLNSASNELNTMLQVLLLELESLQQGYSAAQRRLELARHRFEAGDVMIDEVQTHETQLKRTEVKIEQLEQMIEHFQNIKDQQQLESTEQ